MAARFLPVWKFATGGGGTQDVGIGGATSTTQAFLIYKFPVATRVPPTGISISSAGDFQFSAVAAGQTLGSLVSASNNTDTGGLAGTVASGTPFTAGQYSFLSSTSATAFILWTGAEI